MHETRNINAADAPAPPEGLRDLWYSRGGTACRRVIAAVIYRLYRLLGEAVAVVLGLGAEFGRLELDWLPESEQVVVTIEDAVVKDEAGEILERFDLIRSTLSFEDGLLKPPSLLNAEVKGGVLSFVEYEDGSIKFGLGPPDSVGRLGPVYNSKDTTSSSFYPK